MMLAEGYLVVLQSQPPTETLYNPRYKGIYRIPPFSMQKYKNGFDDPYVVGKYTTSEGLIPDLVSAREMRQDFTRVELVENLEIIYVRELEHGLASTAEIREFRFLGFDVATNRPFWSIVNDSPPPTDPRFDQFLSTLNEYGLFNSEELAAAYLEVYLSHFPNDRDKGLKIWEVYLVESRP